MVNDKMINRGRTRGRKEHQKQDQKKKERRRGAVNAAHTTSSINCDLLNDPQCVSTDYDFKYKISFWVCTITLWMCGCVQSHCGLIQESNCSKAELSQIKMLLVSLWYLNAQA